MRIALAQIDYHVGDFSGNVSRILQAIDRARQNKADLIVFAELAVSGYPPRDFLEFDDFITQCHKAIGQIAAGCVGITAIVGAPERNHAEQGKDLFNSAYVLADGKVKTIRNKTLLPDYDVFDEYRYFEPNTHFDIVHVAGKKVALTICEDLWNFGNNPLYTATPMDELMRHQPDLMINIAASPFNYTQHVARSDMLLANANRYKLPLFYVNHVGAQAELLFDGGSLAIDAHGNIAGELKYFEEDFQIFDTDNFSAHSQQRSIDKYPADNRKIGLINDALVMGIRNYFEKLGFSRAVLGMSGGLDSAVTLALAVQALGKDKVLSVLMPSPFSSQHSVDDSLEMLQNLGSPHETIPIDDVYKRFGETLSPFFKDLPFDLAEENLQARIRGTLLMAMSNKFGYIVLNTSNKSEAAVGYGTLYGDMNGGLSVLGDVYKTDVFALARYINRNGEVIPENIITKPPSAELRPDQKDSDSLPGYDILDDILYQYIELQLGLDELISAGFDEAIVRRVLKMVNSSEYKRHQTPPILRVSTKAFGMGRRMPIVSKYLL
ncbi:MAG TPA: NAD+ synthase [Bacteroidales bacterium]|nr:NAD+ synthase [Bacteroidales bacterium]